MSENQDTLDGGAAAGGVPQILNVLTILTIIGKSILSLLFLIGAFATSWFLSFIGGAASSAMDDMQYMEGMEGVDAAQMQEAAGMMDGLAGMGTGIIMGIFLFFLILQVLCIMGAAKMRKGKKSGFTLYMIGNGIFGIIMIISLLGGNILLPLLTIAFIVLYIVNKKHLTA